MHMRILSVLTVLFLISILVSCSKSVSGNYVNKNNSNEYLELKSDGTYYVKLRGVGMYGKYEVNGDTLTLKGDYGLAFRAKIQGNTIQQEKDESWFSNITWIKK